MIEPGDEIRNSDGKPVKVLSVDHGRYGILVLGEFKNKQSFTTLCPYELEPWDYCSPWYGFCCRCHIITAQGQKLGCVGLSRDQDSALIAHNAEWERTIEAMRDEEMGMKSLSEVRHEHR